ncbi:MAG: mannose-1-phosphate guanylyltransferase [Candidatus Woesearchaeota archaeon]
MNVSVFIMAGGSGTRLAPLSLTKEGRLPKQFQALVSEKTLLQEAIQRVPEEFSVSIIPETRYEHEILSQAEDVSRKIDCLSEPFGCNTAAAIILGCFYSLSKDDDPEKVLFFMPADHIMDDSVFREIFLKATLTASDSGKIVTIGIEPTRPETGYGYIKTTGSSDILDVQEFKEKPDLETAKEYLSLGYYYWNAGIFAFKIKTLLDAAKKDAPLIYEKLSSIKDDISLENIERVYSEIKEAGENISIDFAVMEKEASNMLLVPAPKELKWNDVGGWIALEEYLSPDENSNRTRGSAEFVDSENNTVFNYDGIKIKIDSVSDILIVSTKDGILICPKESAPRAKEIIQGIESGKKVELFDSDAVVENPGEIYIGVIDINDISVKFDGNELVVGKK